MAARLRLPEINQVLRLGFSVLIWIAAAFLARAAGFGFWPVVIFFGISLWLYFFPPLFTKKFAYSFLAILAGIIFTPYIGNWNWIVPLLAGVIFFFILGVKNLIFLRRHSFHLLAHSLMIIWLALLFFAGKLGALSLFALAIILWPLLREYLVVRNSNDEAQSPLINATATAGVFMATELAWCISLLPIGFIEETAIFSALLFLAEDAIYYAINGVLDKRIAIRNSVSAVILVALIFSFSNWTLR